MPVTESINLPSYDELDVQDVNISQPVLLASARFFGKYCDFQSKVRFLFFCYLISADSSHLVVIPRSICFASWKKKILESA